MRQLLGRFKVVPLHLYRLQIGPRAQLREFEAQKKLGRDAYDLKLGDDGLVHPMKGPSFEGPNGMSLRPLGPAFGELIAGFRGRNTRIIPIPEGTVLPSEMVLLHEHSDHYSMQCDEPMSLPDLNNALTAFLDQFPFMTLQEFKTQFPIDKLMVMDPSQPKKM
ncbi:hypothetical protein SeMB42_g07935 [Synchytrium endobioticum]|uniref:Tse2 ADP-ribosyltransferase toxin domain-containing protein n=1 Tax=Synchytrium endobioticum TaxID=286115 RepID=A0A507BK86_9FUNG|nr:hypothetical protein SeMB42_g07935 [Synchytrium endobioticum]TPX35198.1 hypothetical protein SeLEV6574_g08199 [Synchytrium endobioticum]